MGLKDDPFERLVIYSPTDAAFAWPEGVDEHGTDLGQAARGRMLLSPWDLEGVELREGRKPMKFHVRRLGFDELATHVSGDLFTDERLAGRAFRIGVERIELGNGDVLEPTERERAKPPKEPLASTAWLQRVANKLGYRTIIDVGISIAIISRLPLEDVPPLCSRAG